jgi:hypothetical protein
MRIALFATCIGDALFPRVAIATVQLLERLGHEVAFPMDRRAVVKCTSSQAISRRLRDWFAIISTSSSKPAATLVAPSGSCLGTVLWCWCTGDAIRRQGVSRMRRSERLWLDGAWDGPVDVGR